MMFAVLLAAASYGQDISGEWKGNFKFNVFNTIQPTQELIVKLEVYNDTLVEGTTFLGYRRGKFEYYRVRGVYDKDKGVVFFREYQDIQVTPSFFVDYVKGNYSMSLSVKDGMLRMDGRWRENDTEIGVMNSGVWLEKNLPDSTAEGEMKIQEPDKVQATMLLSSDVEFIEVAIKDNAEADGDRISLFWDSNQILHRKELTNTPIVLTLPVVGKTTRLRMIADDEGSVPPCTANIVITANGQQMEQDVWSNSDTNGVIELRVVE